MSRSVVAVLSLWLAVVIFTTSRHEFWRDEVRALTLARAAESPLDLYALLQNEGHPVLWYLLLYLGTSIVDSPLVLPITSIAIAFAAVALFMLAAPFPLWFRCLFVFSALPLYEYSVMARNYGISMLLLFVAAALYRRRAEHPIRLAFALALLANTNVHSAVLAGVLAVVWILEVAFGVGVTDGLTGDQEVRRIGTGDKEARRIRTGDQEIRRSGFPDARSLSWWHEAHGRVTALLPAAAIIAAGLALCAVFVMPPENSSIIPIRHSFEWGQVEEAVAKSATRPHRIFPDLLPYEMPVLVPLVFAVAALGLIGQPSLFVAAAAAQVLFGVLFLLVYPGWYRHQGLYLVFLVFLYWLRVQSGGFPWIPWRRQLLGIGLYGAMVVLLAADIVRLRDTVWRDIRSERSASRSLGEFLRGSARYHEAILVPEPDFAIEALPYYAGNQVYLARERRFGRTVSWTRDVRRRLTLGELLSEARALAGESDVPVLIVLGNWELTPGGGEKRYMYSKEFLWTGEDVSSFRSFTELVAVFDIPHGDEAFAVYAVK